jgi:large subunit ribosomal protein L4
MTSALSARAQEGNVGLFEEPTLDRPRARHFTDFLKAAGMEGAKVCFITNGSNQNFVRSVRNIPGVTVLPHSALNVYDLVNSEVVLMSEGALQGIEEIFGS